MIFLTSVLIAIPFYLSNYQVTFLNSIFESVSGLTGTGFSIFKNIKYLDPTLVLWRSSSQWIGGLFFFAAPSTTPRGPSLQDVDCQAGDIAEFDGRAYVVIKNKALNVPDETNGFDVDIGIVTRFPEGVVLHQGALGSSHVSLKGVHCWELSDTRCKQYFNNPFSNSD